MVRMKCVLNALGKILLIVGCAMILPLFWSLLNGDGISDIFLVTVLVYAACGGFLTLTTKEHKTIRAKEGFLIVTLSWITVSLIGALPYMFSGVLPHFSEAFFETMSGFTTTGATTIGDVESVAGSLLLWRAMTQWLGGLGVVVLFVAVLSQVDTGGLTMLRAELSGPFNEKISSKVQDTAIILWAVYMILTFLTFVLLLFGGMNVTDALCHAFSTVATGGFSTKNTSVAAFNSAYIEWVITVFMFIGGVSFPLLYKTFANRSAKTLFKNEEFKVYGLIVLIVGIIITVDLMMHKGVALSEGIRLAFFQTIAQITTCGFASADYEFWPVASHMILICLMMIGASYSSTSGSIKTGTYVLAVRSIKSQFFKMLHPRALTDVKINGKHIPENTVAKVLQVAFLFFMLTFIGAIFLSFTGMPFTEALTGSMAAISNNGPAAGTIGPMGSYCTVPFVAKWILCALMLLGRLEIFTVMIIFIPAFWRK